MKSLIFKTAQVTILAVVLSSGSATAAPKPKNKPSTPVVVTVVHAIPTGFGADKVDVYANGALLLNDAVPGAMKSFSIEPGSQQIAIYADGVVPTSGTASVLSFRPVYLAQGINASFVAHLDSAGKATLSLFKNMNTEPGKKRSWLTVRHVAAAPAVDIATDSVTLFRSLTNGNERKVSLRYGSYPTEVRLAGTTSVAIPKANITIKDNVNMVVYAWGSASKGNLGYLIQEVATK
ncbi:MAG: hypothetical protein RL694_786, partial [Actinomycetota bacterium]